MTFLARGAKSGGLGPDGFGFGAGLARACSARSPARAIMPKPVEQRSSIRRRVTGAPPARIESGWPPVIVFPRTGRLADIKEFLEVHNGVGQVLPAPERIRRRPVRPPLGIQAGDLPRQALALRTFGGGQG